MGLVAVVESEERVVRARADFGRERLRSGAELLRRHTPTEERTENVGAPPVRLGFGDATHAVTRDAQRPLEELRSDAKPERAIKERQDRKLGRPDAIGRQGRR
jgi:hypothetical protein